MINDVDEWNPASAANTGPEVRRAQGHERAMSLAALRLHAEALLASFENGHAGFVPDEYVTSAGRDVALTVVELCLGGVWTRLDAGYRVISSEALRMAGEVHRQIRQTHGA